MARMISKNISLPLPVVERLEEEDNASKVVRELVVDHYDMADEV